MSLYDVILPAGGRIDPEFAKRVGTDVKALIEFEGKSILERTTDALSATGRVGRIVIVGPDELRSHRGSELASEVLPEGGSGPENILRAIKKIQSLGSHSDKVLVVTSDLPFLTAELLNSFIDACPPEKHICVPLIGRQQWETRFPGMSATFVGLRDGVWTTGCVYVIDLAALERAMPQIERVFEVRKSRLGMAKLLGPVFLARYLTKSLTVPDLEKKIENLLSCRGGAIPNSPPELAYDIDYLDDYEYALKHFEGGSHGTH